MNSPCLRKGLANIYLVPLLLPLVFVMMPDYWVQKTYNKIRQISRKNLFSSTSFNYTLYPDTVY